MGMKLSEARVLVLLENICDENKYAAYLSAKLSLDYQHLIHVLKSMKLKGWIVCVRGKVKKFYDLTPEAPLNEAKERIIKGGEKSEGKQADKESL